MSMHYELAGHLGHGVVSPRSLQMADRADPTRISGLEVHSRERQQLGQ